MDGMARDRSSFFVWNKKLCIWVPTNSVTFLIVFLYAHICMHDILRDLS